MKWKVMLVIVLAFILYSFDLSKTTIFISDIARDTTRSLEILTDKELTLIGPPVSFGQDGTRNVFFGSGSLYLGALGLFIWGKQPLGAAYITVLLFVVSLPFLYLLIRRMSDSGKVAFLGTAMYALSPLVVSHARFFWNANFLLPFSIGFWYAIERKKWLIAGILAGILVNFHYIALIPILTYLGFTVFKGQWKESMRLSAGLLLGLVPLILFELRNNFYLTQSVLFNIQQAGGTEQFSLLPLVSRFSEPLLSFVGLLPAEIVYSTVTLPASWITQVLSVVLLIVVIFYQKPFIKKYGIRGVIVEVIYVCVVLGASNETVHMRYFFPVLPLLAWIVADVLSQMKVKYLAKSLLIFMFLVSSLILLERPDPEKNYISLQEIENVTDAIVDMKPQGNYNITENIRGDARARSFRYFLLRDADVQPQDPETYVGLDTLYVVSPSEEKIYDEARWEFTATEDLELVETREFENVWLFVFKKTQISDN